MLTPRGASNAWRHGHLSAQTPNSPVLHDVVTDAESPAHCVCDGNTFPLRRGGHCECITKHSKSAPPGLHHNVVTDAESPAHCVCDETTFPLRRGGHCECIKKHSKRAPPGLHHNVITDAESPAHCVCPGSEVPVRYGDGHCDCVAPHLKRENDPVPNSSQAPSKAAVTASKSTATAPKLSVTGSSTFITTTKSSTARQNSSENTAQDTVTVKPISPSATVQSVTATVSVVATTDAGFLPDIIEVPVHLPLLTRPVLICLFGGCFGSNELSSITSSFGKRVENRDLADLPHLRGHCHEHSLLLCSLDHEKCFCHHRSKRALPEDSVAHQCPDQQLLVCGVSDCSCVEIPSKPLSPVPASCSTGALICFEGLCYCPLVTGKRPESGIRPEGLGP